MKTYEPENMPYSLADLDMRDHLGRHAHRKTREQLRAEFVAWVREAREKYGKYYTQDDD